MDRLAVSTLPHVKNHTGHDMANSTTDRGFAPPPPRLRAASSAAAQASSSAKRDAVARQPYPLSVRAARWLQTLDERIRVDTVRQQCPEILDRLARHWDHPEELRRVFDDLLFTGEAPRARPPGCSFQALCEIAALRHHAVVDLRKWRMSAWDSALDLR